MDNKTKDLTRVSFGITIMFLVFWIYNFFLAKYLPISEPLKSLISTISLYVVGLGLFIFITRDIDETKYKKGKLSFKTYLICFLLQFSALIIMLLLTALSTFFTKKVPSVSNNLSLPMLFSLLVFAPIVEEIVFRYVFAKKLLKYGEAFFVLVSAFCFCIVHGVSIGINAIVYTFILGLIWSYLLVKTGNVWISVIYHSLSNFFGAILSQIILTYFEQLFPLYFILIIVSAISGLILFIKNKKDFTFADKVFSRNNLKTIFTNKGIMFLTLATITFMIIKSVAG